MKRMFIHHRNVSGDTEIISLPKSLTRFYTKYAMRGHWPLIIALALVMIYNTFGSVLYPLTERWFVAMFEHPVNGVLTFVSRNLPVLLFIVGIQMSWTICGILRGVLYSRRNAFMGNQISETLNDYLQHQSMQYWTEHNTGTLHSQIGYVTKGITAMDELLRMVTLILTMIVNVALMFSVNIWITMIFAFIFVTRLIYSVIMIRPMKNSAKAASEANSKLSGHIVDSLSNSFIVRLFAGSRHEKQQLKPARAEQIKTRLHANYIQRWFWAPFSFIWDLGFGAVLLICLYLYAQGELLVSAAVFTVSVYYSVTSAISNFVNIIPDVVDNISSATKAYSELSKPIAIVDKPGASDLVVSRGKIEFKNVWFKYKRKWILRDLSLTIMPGERVGVVGPSGAGKSTLVNLLMRFWEPNRGQILIDGVDIRDVTQDSLHRAIGFIPQEPTLFDRTLRENICYGAPNATVRQMRTAARRAAADEFIMATDKKYESYVGERGIKLSGGQKQRIAIARAFLKNAPLLVLDEATSALDSETEVAIQSAFEELARGRTTIAIAHRLSTLRNMDRIVVIQDGKIIEMGSHRQLLKHKNGEYARLWKMQSGGFIKE